MSQDPLSAAVPAIRAQYGIPGVAVGVWHEGRERIACDGVTSLDNPLPVTADTLFLVGSVTKTFTATALMRLVADGKVELEAPVRRYLPELRLADESVAERVTPLHLLNHTAGLDWGVLTDTGDGDDALARNVAQMAQVKLIAPLGTRASYSQSGFNILGRIVEKVTGVPFERAIATLLLEPLGLAHSFFAAAEVLTRRFVVGHNRAEDGTMAIARLWKHWRGNNPGADLCSSITDQLRWARFHLGDGTALDGTTRLLPAALLQRMQRPTVALRASSLGDAIGIGWFLREVDGVATVGHGGSSNGQFAELLMVPDRGFAVVSLANANPNGIPFNRAAVRWALEHYLGLIDRDPEPLPFDPAKSREISGHYEIDAMTMTVGAENGRFWMDIRIRPEIRAAATTELPPDHAPAELGLLPTGTDEYVLLTGGMKGQRGFFTRDGDGRIVGVDIAGRLFRRS